MKKTIIIISIIAAASLLTAVLLGIALGGDGTQIVTGGTTGTSATTGGISGITACDHVYEGDFCTSCGAEKPTPNEFLSFSLLEDGTYSVRAKLITELPARLIIPEYYEGKPVTVIKKKGFIGAKNLKYVYIPEGVTTIEDEAFLECVNARLHIAQMHRIYFVIYVNGHLHIMGV